MRKAPLLVVLAVCLGVAGRAHAGPSPRPVIEAHPEVVEYRDRIEIIGSVEKGAAGETVYLERRRPALEGWVVIGKSTLDESNSVRFVVENVRRTAYYRLRWNNEVSEEVRVRVRALLTLDVATKDLMEGQATVLSGFLRPAVEGRSVLLERRVQGDWEPIGRALVEDGRYALPGRFAKSGYRALRATFQKDEINDGKRVRSLVRVHRPSLATWYGPGFFGNRTACGQRYTRRTIGVAHRKLPCGTRVHVLFNEETIALKVIDRGPFTDANWDLSQRAARKIGFYGKEDIGILIKRS